MQRAFRAALSAMARPGTVTRMPLFAENEGEGDVRYPAVSASLATLIDLFVDQATTVAVASDMPALEQALAAETHAHARPADRAAFVVVPKAAGEACAEDAVSKAAGGTFESPETGATVLIECDRIASDGEAQRAFGSDAAHRASAYDASEEPELIWVSVEGPGVKDSHTFGVDRIEWVWARNRREDEFPCGIDIILTDPSGRVVALPRTSFVSLRAGKEAQ